MNVVSSLLLQKMNPQPSRKIHLTTSVTAWVNLLSGTVFAGHSLLLNKKKIKTVVMPNEQRKQFEIYTRVSLMNVFLNVF